MKKIIMCLLGLSMMASSPMTIAASEEAPDVDNTVETEEITLDFRDFSYTETIESGDYEFDYYESDDEEGYYIYDSSTGLLVEKISVKYAAETRAVNPNAHTAFFTRDLNINGNGKNVAVIRFTACVLYYSSGSFRSFEALQYTNVTIPTSICSMYLENTSSSAWSNTGTWPCVQLDYAYTTTAATSTATGSNFSAYLISAGFELTTYYRKVINSSGSIKLYN